MKSENLSLRETKRRATRAAIEEHATRLVLAHGFDNVTVDDICQAAGISKRTFFNYMDSKETAVLGPLPRVLSEEETAAFIAEVHDPLLPAVIELMMDNFIDGYGSTPTAVRQRRKNILSSSPDLGSARMKLFIDAHTAYRSALHSYFRAHPSQRLLPELTPFAEADTWMMLVASCVKLGLQRWAEGDDESDDSLRTACHAALGHLHSITTNSHGAPSRPHQAHSSER